LTATTMDRKAIDKIRKVMPTMYRRNHGIRSSILLAMSS
jgi:hypothetical protein